MRVREGKTEKFKLMSEERAEGFSLRRRVYLARAKVAFMFY